MSGSKILNKMLADICHKVKQNKVVVDSIDNDANVKWTLIVVI